MEVHVQELMIIIVVALGATIVGSHDVAVAVYSHQV